MRELVDIVSRFGSPRIVLLGDFILDRYVYGDVERINPEAPVPVLRKVRSLSIPGGAGNVAVAAAAMGARVFCAGVIGEDEAGEQIANLLTNAGADASGLVRRKDRPTALKTRYVGLAQHRHAQQMLRVDEESAAPLDERIESELREAVRRELAAADIVVLEDYDKGVFAGDLARRIIDDANQAGKRVLVDPACIGDYRRYRGAALVKPNRYEADLASGIRITDDAALAESAGRLIEIADAQAVLISLDREGAYLRVRNQPGKRISHQRPRSAYDITGAGDETMAVLAVAMAQGCDCEQAAALANVAGGLEVERFGFVPITRQEVLDELRRLIGLRGGKVLDRKILAEEVRRRKARGEKIVFTNGCFDLLHAGHLRYLQEARELGGLLIVAINSDDSVRRLKGPGRPVIGQDERAEMIGALECVDFVTVFDEDTPSELLELLRPDVLVKGGTTDVIIGRDIVESYGGRVVTTGAARNLSTTKIIGRILETRE